MHGERQLVARLAAPVAFLLAATIAVLLVRSAIHAGDRSPSVQRAAARADRPAAGSARKNPQPPSRPRRRSRPSARYATVEAGETLETIATENGTSVERLLELNPGIDPRTLHTGQRVRVA